MDRCCKQASTPLRPERWVGVVFGEMVMFQQECESVETGVRVRNTLCATEL
jgi:hypothetical protein